MAPGEFFVCTADVPRGSSLDIRVEMVSDIGQDSWTYISVFQFDDEKNKTDTDTGWMPVPEMVTLNGHFNHFLIFSFSSVEEHSWGPPAHTFLEPDHPS